MRVFLAGATGVVGKPLVQQLLAARQRETMAAIHYLERAVVGAPLTGIALRYGNLYGPGA